MFRTMTSLSLIAAGLLSACGGTVPLGSGEITQSGGQSGATGGALDTKTEQGGSGNTSGVGGFMALGGTVSTGGSATSVPNLPLEVAQACAAVVLGVAHPVTQGDLVHLLVGEWAQCSSQSVFCSSDDEGISINPDGTWVKLYRDSSGSLVPGTDPTQQGTWRVIDTSAMNGPGVFQLNFDVLAGGGIGTLPEISADGSKLHMNNNGVCAGDYVRISAPVNVPDAGAIDAGER